MPEQERRNPQSVEALEAEVNQMYLFIHGLQQLGAYDRSTNANASEIRSAIAQILTDFKVYDSLVLDLPVEYRLRELNKIKAKVIDFLKKYQLTLSEAKSDYDVISDALASVKLSEGPAHDVEQEIQEEIDELLNQIFIVRDQLMKAKNSGKLHYTEKKTAIFYLTKINTLKNNIYNFSLDERLSELRMLHGQLQSFVQSLGNKVEPLVRYSIEQLGEISVAEGLFHDNFLILIQKVNELDAVFDSLTDLEQLTQSNRIENMKALFEELQDCISLVTEYHKTSDTLPYKERMQAIKGIIKMVNKAIRAIND